MNIRQLYEIYLKHPVISVDTRKPVENSVFFCLKGKFFDGNTFASQALDKGAACVVIDNPAYFIEGKTVLVENTLKTLQELASFHRRQMKIPVIGITGTNGKTTTKELVHTVLAKKFRVSATKGNLNNQIGVPLTLLAIDNNTEIAVIEMGASYPGEIAELCRIAMPDFGIITNIGKAHLEGFGSFENIIATKTALYEFVGGQSGHVFVNAENNLLMQYAAKLKKITYGVGKDNFCRGKLVSAEPFLKVRWGRNFENLAESNLIGKYNFENLLAAICTGLYFGVPDALINQAIADYHPENMRSQYLKTGKNEIILDAYNANPDSLRMALENFMEIKHPSKAVILGDMLELGEVSASEHLKIIEILKTAGFDKVILTGPVFCEVNPCKNFYCFPDSEKTLSFLKEKEIRNSLILIKGSRGIQLEKVLPAL